MSADGDDVVEHKLLEDCIEAEYKYLMYIKEKSEVQFQHDTAGLVWNIHDPLWFLFEKKRPSQQTKLDENMRRTWKKVLARIHPDKNHDHFEQCTRCFHIVTEWGDDDTLQWHKIEQLYTKLETAADKIVDILTWIEQQHKFIDPSDDATKEKKKEEVHATPTAKVSANTQMKASCWYMWRSEAGKTYLKRFLVTPEELVRLATEERGL